MTGSRVVAKYTIVALHVARKWRVHDQEKIGDTASTIADQQKA